MLILSGSDTLLLDGEIEDYEYLNKSRREVDGVDDREEWNALKVSFHAYHDARWLMQAISRMLWTPLGSLLQSNSIYSALLLPSCT